MNHGKTLGKLNRGSDHRRSLLRNLATSLVLSGRIETTVPRAKELRRIADKLVTLGKKGTLHARRQAMSYLFAINQHYEGNAQKLTAVHKLFEELAPKFKNRNGGYTRVLRTRHRDGDNAEMAVIEFVEGDVQKKERRKRRVVKEAKVAAEVEATSAAE